MMAISLVLVSFIDWSHESHEFTWDDPVHISVFDSLMEFVLLDVEGLELIPVEFDGVFEALQHLQEGALVAAVAFRSVSVSLE